MTTTDTIRFICSECSYRARLPAKYDGKHIKCPSCKTTQKVVADTGDPTGSTVSIKRLSDDASSAPDKFRFTCTDCGYRARIPVKYAGMAIKCPGCGAAQQAEMPEDEAAEEPAGDTVQITKVDVSGKDADGRFRFQCDDCGYRAKLPERFAGQTIKCPGCGAAQKAEALDASVPSSGDTMVLQVVEEVSAESLPSTSSDFENEPTITPPRGLPAVPPEVVDAPAEQPGAGGPTAASGDEEPEPSIRPGTSAIPVAPVAADQPGSGAAPKLDVAPVHQPVAPPVAPVHQPEAPPPPPPPAADQAAEPTVEPFAEPASPQPAETPTAEDSAPAGVSYPSDTAVDPVDLRRESDGADSQQDDQQGDVPPVGTGSHRKRRAVLTPASNDDAAPRSGRGSPSRPLDPESAAPVVVKKGGKGGVIFLFLLLLAALGGGGYVAKMWLDTQEALTNEQDAHKGTRVTLTTTQGQLGDLQTKHAALQQAKQELETQFATTKAELEGTIASLQTTVSDLETQVTGLGNDLKAKVQELTDQTALLEKTKASLGEAEAAKQQAEESIAELQQTIETINKGGMSLKAQLDAAQADAKKQAAAKAELQKELDELKAKLEQLDESTLQKLFP